MAAFLGILFLSFTVQASSIVTGDAYVEGPHSVSLNSTLTVTSGGSGQRALYYILTDDADSSTRYWGGFSFTQGGLTGTFHNSKTITDLKEVSTYDWKAAIVDTSTNAEVASGSTKQFTTLAVPGNESIGPEYTGSWYNSAEDGHGFSFEVGRKANGTYRAVVYWYVYNSVGEPIFLIGSGPAVEGSVTLTLKAPYGMQYGVFDPESVERPDAGTATFIFQDSNNGTFSYSPSEWAISNLGHSAHEMPITKLFKVSHPLGPVNEIELNDEQESATVFGLGDTLVGNLSGVTDIDWFSVNISSEQTGMLAVDFDASSVDSGWWSVDWYDPEMSDISGRNIQAPEGFQYEFPAFTAGTYYLRVMIEEEIFYSGGPYKVSVEKAP